MIYLSEQLRCHALCLEAWNTPKGIVWGMPSMIFHFFGSPHVRFLFPWFLLLSLSLCLYIGTAEYTDPNHHVVMGVVAGMQNSSGVAVAGIFLGFGLPVARLGPPWACCLLPVMYLDATPFGPGLLDGREGQTWDSPQHISYVWNQQNHEHCSQILLRICSSHPQMKACPHIYRHLSHCISTSWSSPCDPQTDELFLVVGPGGTQKNPPGLPD